MKNWNLREVEFEKLTNFKSSNLQEVLIMSFVSFHAESNLIFEKFWTYVHVYTIPLH